MAARSRSVDRSLFEVVSRRRWVALATLLIGLAALLFLVLHMHKKYGGIAHVLLINDASGRDPASAGLDMPTIATSTAVIGDVKNQLRLSDSISDIAKAVTAHVAPRSSIMSIAYRSSDPGLALSVPNAVADRFVSYYSSLPKSRSQAVVASYRDLLRQKRDELSALEARTEAAAAGRSYVGSQTSLDNLAKDLDDLREQRALAYGTLVGDRATVAANRTQPDRLSKIVRHEILDNDRNYHQLLIDVSRDNSSFTTYRAGVTDQYPGLPGYQDKVRKEDGALSRARTEALSGPDAYSPSLGGQIVESDKAAASLAGDQAHVEALDTQIAALQSQLADSSSASADAPSIGALRAMRDTVETQYATLATRFSTAEANAAESASLGQVVVVDRAVKPEPNILGPQLLFAVGAVVVLVLAVLAAYLAELVNPKLFSRADVEALYGRPTLASLRTK